MAGPAVAKPTVAKAAAEEAAGSGAGEGSSSSLGPSPASLDSLDSFSNLHSCPSSSDLTSDDGAEAPRPDRTPADEGGGGPAAAAAAASWLASKERFPGQSLYHIKWIQWKEESTPIITQNENGPCPLLAILNVLLLAWKVKLPPMMEIITAEQLMEYLGDYILDAKPKDISEIQRLNYEQNMSDAMAILHKLQTGLDVNVKFTGVRVFEYTPECIVFDLLAIPLYHGWLVDPQIADIVKAVGNCSYNQLVEKIISCKQSDNSELVSEGSAVPAGDRPGFPDGRENRVGEPAQRRRGRELLRFRIPPAASFRPGDGVPGTAGSDRSGLPNGPIPPTRAAESGAQLGADPRRNQRPGAGKETARGGGPPGLAVLPGAGTGAGPGGRDGPDAGPAGARGGLPGQQPGPRERRAQAEGAPGTRQGEGKGEEQLRHLVTRGGVVPGSGAGRSLARSTPSVPHHSADSVPAPKAGGIPAHGAPLPAPRGPPGAVEPRERRGGDGARSRSRGTPHSVASHANHGKFCVIVTFVTHDISR
ncbi:ubiquitin carboxyl-terminal hydrolase MINDY-2 isoform X1 [Ornithorhynchus anatinus]|uniref:ubiquitin carboxyl-terminal hydrolase MINDY-2 isoform X1 n=1 Tax=Ornithorhynchus anatinus TaxID=9258 RepID=UPI0019D499AE|nr:ubiquitin carboxyl-terminal hydrolase MINDY-2 isoform X1 [Ornithorhynchus anatinus]